MQRTEAEVRRALRYMHQAAGGAMLGGDEQACEAALTVAYAFEWVLGIPGSLDDAIARCEADDADEARQRKRLSEAVE